MRSLDHYYAALNLSAGASLQEVKRAYVKLAKQWHPDRFPHDPQLRREAEARFKDISEAYHQLKAHQPQSSPFSQSNSKAAANKASSKASVNTNSVDVEHFYQLAVDLALREKDKEAIQALSQAIKLRPDLLKAYQFRAFLNEKLGYHNAAQSDFEKVSELKDFSNPSKARPETRHAHTHHETKIKDLPWKETYAFTAHTKTITAITVQNRLAISSSLDGTVKVWNLEDLRELATLKGHKGAVLQVISVASDPVAVSVGMDRLIRFWSLQQFKAIRTLGGGFEGHHDTVRAIALTPDQKILVSGGDDRTIKLWNLKNGQIHRSLEEFTQPISVLAISPDGLYFANDGEDKAVQIRRIQTGELIVRLSLESAVNSLSFSPDDTWLACGCADGVIQLWDVNTGKCCFQLTGHKGSVDTLAFHSKQMILLSGSADCTAKLWDLEQKSLLASLEHPDWVTAVCLPAEDTVITGCRDSKIRVWCRTTKH